MLKTSAALSCAALALALTLGGCGDAQVGSPLAERDLGLMNAELAGEIQEPVRGMEHQAGEQLLAGINRQLSQAKAGYAVIKAEYITLPGENMETGQVLFASDHFKHLGVQWAPHDERRNADGNNITYIVESPYGAANPEISAEDAEAAIDRSFDTWERESCQDLNLVKRTETGEDITVVDGFLGFGGFGDPFQADIVSAGFFGPAFFEALTPGGSQFILAVTFTLGFSDADDNPTDINKDGFIDAAFREVYYNNAFAWSLGDSPGIDIETVALHENGHALGMGHFGNLFVTTRNGKLHTSPRAVMNAAYTGPLRRLRGTDSAGYCGIYANWPSE